LFLTYKVVELISYIHGIHITTIEIEESIYYRPQNNERLANAHQHSCSNCSDYFAWGRALPGRVKHGTQLNKTAGHIVEERYVTSTHLLQERKLSVH